MHYTDLRDFIDKLESLGELKRIGVEVDPHLKSQRYVIVHLRRQGPALLFENVKDSKFPVLGNLFEQPEEAPSAWGGVGRSTARCWQACSPP